ncbi:RHS repeat-associated core domain-containing protein, partial [Methanosarcinaceae archaeon]|nr:RHS repeat-associated core domain-containing protein [Methanosarcinaceae archaeon]
AKESSDGRYWYLVDHLGSTNVMIDSTGTLVERSLYYPFGSYRSGVADEKYGFTGKEFDSDTGLYYYGARYYNPEIFVFTQADSVLPDVYNPQALNRYAYCLNNPLKYEDPDGHSPTLLTAAAGLVAGAVIAGVAEAGRQLITTGKISDRNAVVKAAVVGGVVGGVTGLTLGIGTALVASESALVCAIVGAEFGAVGGFAGSVAGGATEYVYEEMFENGSDETFLNSAFDGEAILENMTLAAAGGAVSGAVGIKYKDIKYVKNIKNVDDDRVKTLVSEVAFDSTEIAVKQSYRACSKYALVIMKRDDKIQNEKE